MIRSKQVKTKFIWHLRVMGRRHLKTSEMSRKGQWLRWLAVICFSNRRCYHSKMPLLWQLCRWLAVTMHWGILQKEITMRNSYQCFMKQQKMLSCRSSDFLPCLWCISRCSPSLSKALRWWNSLLIIGGSSVILWLRSSAVSHRPLWSLSLKSVTVRRLSNKIKHLTSSRQHYHSLSYSTFRHSSLSTSRIK